MSDIDKMFSELQALGLSPSKVQVQGYFPEMIVFDYSVKGGPFSGKDVKIGIGVSEPGYPEFPPHWLCVSGLQKDGIRQHVHSDLRVGDDEWLVFSAPPKDFWDQLNSEEKNMQTYVQRHLVRFWSQM